MSTLKKLAGQTAVYGLSSMLGRLLNFLLVPLYTNVFSPQEFGIVTEMYAYVVFFIVLLTYGMETTLFRFSKKHEDQKDLVYSTALISVIVSSIVFIFACVFFSSPLSQLLGYDTHPEYITWFALILGFDAITAIPFAKLREKNMAERFAIFKLLGIILNIVLNLFFIVYCPHILKGKNDGFREFVEFVYNKDIGVGYIFIANLISSSFTLLLLLPTILSVRLRFDSVIFKNMIPYAMPLLIAGMAGTINETLDRIILKQLVSSDLNPLHELGIYGASYKLAMFMTLFIQAFRFASEPFFFSQSSDKESPKLFARVMKYFVIVCILIFLIIMLYMDIVKYFIGSDFHEGLKVVPILLLANLCLGVFINLSIWYKLTDKTSYGSYLAIFGAIITIALNCALVPLFSYVGAAWATLLAYGSMMVASYYFGQKYYPIPYNKRKLVFYLVFAVGLYYSSTLLGIEDLVNKLIVNSVFLILYVLIIYVLERPKKVLI